MTTRCHTYSGGDAVVIHGDCLSALNTIPNGTIDLVFADPPYNIGKNFGDFNDRWPSLSEYVEWCYEWLAACIRALKSTGSLYVMSSTQAMPFLDIWLRDHIAILSRVVWHYDSSGVQAKSYFGSLYEPILHCVKDKNQYTFNADEIAVEARTGAVRNLIDYRKPTPAPYGTTKVPGNAWYFPRVRYRMREYEEHPAQKPEALMERIVRASSNVGETVLDPFAGTFTTCAVADRFGRKSIGIEQQLRYVKVGIRRLGISSHFRGERLEPPTKSFLRKAKQTESPNESPDSIEDLFDGSL